MSDDFEKRMLERRKAREERRKRLNNFINGEIKQDDENLNRNQEELKNKLAQNLKLGITTLREISKEKILDMVNNKEKANNTNSDNNIPNNKT